MREPCAISMNGGTPPTPRNARTGEFTPPGITSCARWKSVSDCLAIAGGHYKRCMRTALTLIITLCTVTAVAEEPLINADRPGIADSSTTLDRGAFQVELGV